MKNYLLLMCITTLNFFAQAQNKKIVADCTINYSVSSSNAVNKNNLGTKTIYIKGKDLRVDLMSSTFSQTIFYNAATGAATVLKTIGNAKYISTYTNAQWQQQNALYNNLTLSFTNITKQILSYTCKQVLLQFKNGEVYTVYYYPEIMPSVCENPFEFKDVPGLILEYESESGNSKLTYSAVKIDFNPVPSAQFDIPKTGYRVLN